MIQSPNWQECQTLGLFCVWAINPVWTLHFFNISDSKPLSIVYLWGAQLTASFFLLSGLEHILRPSFIHCLSWPKWSLQLSFVCFQCALFWAFKWIVGHGLCRMWGSEDKVGGLIILQSVWGGHHFPLIWHCICLWCFAKKNPKHFRSSSCMMWYHDPNSFWNNHIRHGYIIVLD